MSTFAVLALPLHGSATFGAFIKCYHKPFFLFFLLSPFGATFVHLQKEFQQRGSRASEATQGCMFNAEQMWGDMRSRDAAGVSESLGELMSSAGKHRQLEHLSLLVLLPFLSFFFFHSRSVWCLVSSQGPCCFYTWCHGATLSPGKLIRWAPDEVWTVKKQHTDACCLFLLKLPLPLDNLGFSLIKSLSEKSRLCS